MKQLIPAGVLAAMLSAGTAYAQEAVEPVMSDRIGQVAPALKNYTTEGLFGSVWSNDALSARDRSLVTVAILITRNQNDELAEYIGRALKTGVKPAEVSETITHLAFYTGWSNAMSAVDAAAEAFEAAGVSKDQLPAVEPEPLPLNKEAEDAREAQVQGNFGEVSQGVVDNTREFLFLNLWLRPDLAPRDRSLITVVALIASGGVAQMPFHLNKAMDNGLTAKEVDGVLAHTAFYTGWPSVFTALPVAKEILAGRAN
ncbi:carboxymuconolactone decarboxylase family protein (plasmid) [Ensifer sp. D2-11]